jgi:signal recognition particle receptor subunit beta
VAQIDFTERQLTLKLVYYGPPRSGKTTNLHQIHSQVDALNRGRLMTLDTKDDRTLFFDLLPIFFRTSALSFRVKVYTVPGQPMHDATRRVVLRQADGVVFVADSRRDNGAANKSSYQDLLDNLQRLGLDRPRLPVVVQYNKRDLEDIVADSEMVGFEDGQRVFPASAVRGEGVMETFFGLIGEAWDSIDARVGLAGPFKLGRDAFMTALREHVRPVLHSSS